MRLIDADALKKQLCLDKFEAITRSPERRMVTFDEIAAFIDCYAPTIEPKRGEWKRRIVDNGFNADWVCSECGYRVKTDFVDYNFCPNCGARMGEREGE